MPRGISKRQLEHLVYYQYRVLQLCALCQISQLSKNSYFLCKFPYIFTVHAQKRCTYNAIFRYKTPPIYNMIDCRTLHALFSSYALATIIYKTQFQHASISTLHAPITCCLASFHAYTYYCIYCIPVTLFWFVNSRGLALQCSSYNQCEGQHFSALVTTSCLLVQPYGMMS